MFRLLAWAFDKIRKGPPLPTPRVLPYQPCDRCSADAKWIVVISEKLQLELCGHHFAVVKESITQKGYTYGERGKGL